MPRAIGMFGHSLEPAVLRQPARVHVPAARRVLGALGVRDGGRRRVRGRSRAPRSRSRACSRRCSARPPSGCSPGRARGSSTGASGSSPAALLAVAFLPVHYAHLAVNDVPGAGAAVPEPGRRSPASTATAGCATTRWRARRSASPARRSTRPGSCCCALLAAAARCRRPPAARTRRARARARGCRWRSRASWSPTRTRCSTSTRSATGSREQSEASTDGGGKLGLVADSGVLYYLGTLDLGARLDPRARGRRRRRLARGQATAGWRWCSSPRRCCSCSSWACRTASSRAGCCRSIRCCACSRRWARGRGAAARRRARCARRRPARCCARRASSSRPQRPACSRAPDTRALARDWMVANIPEGAKVVIEPIAPDQWAMDVGRPSRLTAHRPPLGQVARRRTSAAGGSSSRTTSARSARRCSTATPARATAS